MTDKDLQISQYLISRVTELFNNRLDEFETNGHVCIQSVATSIYALTTIKLFEMGYGDPNDMDRLLTKLFDETRRMITGYAAQMDFSQEERTLH